jgi:hypothetical protein
MSPSPPLLTICVPPLMNRSASTAAVCPSNVRKHALPLPALPLPLSRVRFIQI